LQQLSQRESQVVVTNLSLNKFLSRNTFAWNGFLLAAKAQIITVDSIFKTTD